jgi:O6-methylguanine-DNA--protein-cysteine methyltransferase
MKSSKKNIKNNDFKSLVEALRQKEGFNVKTEIGRVNVKLYGKPKQEKVWKKLNQCGTD